MGILLPQDKLWTPAGWAERYFFVDCLNHLDEAPLLSERTQRAVQGQVFTLDLRKADVPELLEMKRLAGYVLEDSLRGDANRWNEPRYFEAYVERVGELSHALDELLVPSALRPEVLFTWEEYQAFVTYVGSLRFQHEFATSTRKFGEAADLARRILLELPPLYRTKLPTYLLARCPICRASVTEPIDTFSLSGIGWWISEPRGFGWFGRPLKGVHEMLRPLATSCLPEPGYRAGCEHAQAVIYGVQLNSILPDDLKSVGMVVIGSERPGVLRPFMEREGSRAVVHTLPVGRLDEAQWRPRYTAHFVTYFSPDPGAFRQSLASRDWYSTDFVWPYVELDYDLTAWLEAGKLFWLGREEEGDPLLQKPAEEFPYAGMDGLTGRWAVHASGLKLLPPLSGSALYNPAHLALKAIKPEQEAALSQRGLKSFWPQRGMNER